MGIEEWFSQNWVNIVTAISGIGGLWAAVFAIRKDAKARRDEAEAHRVGNLIALSANHREVWKDFFRSPELLRVIDPVADVVKEPITPAEEFFVNLVTSHTSTTYEALKYELLTKQEGLRRDIAQFFSLPVPKAVWSKTKLLQNQDFAAFIESSLK